MPTDSRTRVATRPSPPRATPRGAGAPPPRRGDRSGVAPRGRKRRGVAFVAIGIAVILIASGAFVVVRVIAGATPSCKATIGNETVRIDREQAVNARVIAAVAAEVGMPNHAVTVALAAAFQESKLHNISHGDRDSVGLFQQRPSQGWGSPAQLTTPRYAASAFYRALSRVDGWQTMTVTEAAQHVQRSAAPDAYAKWEPEARLLARILTGEVPDTLVCT
ncbi:MAG: hypothetical protein ACXVKA_03050 [Acidimicrobiia bacterium]